MIIVIVMIIFLILIYTRLNRFYDSDLPIPLETRENLLSEPHTSNPSIFSSVSIFCRLTGV